MGGRTATGVRTFLFTDIEGSTRRWEQHPAAMAAAHRRQEALIRAVLAAHNGSIIKIIGDAFQTVFATAPAALAAAVAAQRALAAEPWPTLSPLRVRMAWHTGLAEQRGPGDRPTNADCRPARVSQQ